MTKIVLDEVEHTKVHKTACQLNLFYPLKCSLPPKDRPGVLIVI